MTRDARASDGRVHVRCTNRPACVWKGNRNPSPRRTGRAFGGSLREPKPVDAPCPWCRSAVEVRGQ